jgi:hypothetical protein
MTVYRDSDTRYLAAFSQHLEIAEALRPDETTAGWFGMWDQLASARHIAIAHGRDVRNFDAARSRAHATAFLDSDGTRMAREASDHAIDALRAAFPEVVVPGPTRRTGASRSLPQLAVSRTRSQFRPSSIPMHHVILRSQTKRSFWARPTAPIGQFAPRCVCCNAATDRQCSYIPAGDGSYRSGAIWVPCCPECKGHIGRTLLGSVVVLLAVAGIIALIAGIVTATPAGVLGGGFALLACGFGRMQQRHIKQHLYRNAHHPIFAVEIVPDHFTLTTSSSVLADEFERRNR